MAPCVSSTNSNAASAGQRTPIHVEVAHRVPIGWQYDRKTQQVSLLFPGNNYGLRKQSRVPASIGRHQQQPTPSSSTSNRYDHAQSPQNPKSKRSRTAFTTQQLSDLEDAYLENRYPDRRQRDKLAKRLALNERTIKIWFQNRRMKEKTLTRPTEQESDNPTISMPGNVKSDIYRPLQGYGTPIQYHDKINPYYQHNAGTPVLAASQSHASLEYYSNVNGYPDSTYNQHQYQQQYQPQIMEQAIPNSEAGRHLPYHDLGTSSPELLLPLEDPEQEHLPETPETTSTNGQDDSEKNPEIQDQPSSMSWIRYSLISPELW